MLIDNIYVYIYIIWNCIELWIIKFYVRMRIFIGFEFFDLYYIILGFKFGV